MEFRPFTDDDWRDWEGTEGNPLIGEVEAMGFTDPETMEITHNGAIIIIDANGFQINLQDSEGRHEEKIYLRDKWEKLVFTALEHMTVLTPETLKHWRKV